MKPINRRTFIKGSLLTAGAMALPARSWAKVLGANDDIRMAVIGFHGRGQSHINGFRSLPGVRVVALCDVDRHVLDRTAQKFRDRNEPIETYTDLRRLLENKDIDAVSTATPNHWHSLVTVWACQAGKDVYVEKPVCHEVWEGEQMVAAARKYNRIVQTGTQCRSSTGIQEGIQFLHDGKLGAIKVARGLCYKRRKSIGHVPGPTPIPNYIDYNIWCGPAPMVPLMREHLHYDWHWVWPTGNGDIGNQGIHQMDIARWALNVDHLSPRVFSIGGRFGYIDDGQTPNTLITFHDYDKAPLIFEVRGLPHQAGSNQMDNYHGARIGVVIDAEGGRMVIPSYDTAIAYADDGSVIKKFKGGGNHFANFIQAVRSRKVSDLNADIWQGFLSSSLCHTSNDSYLMGYRRKPEEIREKIKGDKEATETYNRFAAHLEANNVDLDKTPAALGAHLKMNPTTMRFTNNEEANWLLKREYREPFVVPDHV